MERLGKAREMEFSQFVLQKKYETETFYYVESYKVILNIYCDISLI